MTDRQLALALSQAAEMEHAARTQWTASTDDLPERDAALVVVRHATALKRALEQWISARSCRSLMGKTVSVFR